jgi:hypothetical protein
MAVSKESLVRVDGSKNRLAMILPRHKLLTFLALIRSASAKISSICPSDKSSTLVRLIPVMLI